MDEIQRHSRPLIERCYREFLVESADPEEREYPDPADQIREVLIHGNYMSQKDIDICLDFDPDPLHNHPKFDAVISLHCILWDTYAPWDGDQHFLLAARRAVERKMAAADWDDDEKVIYLEDNDGLAGYISVSSREELEEYLRGVARGGYYAYIPEDAEYACECDENEIVVNVLSRFHQRLSMIFQMEELPV